MAERESVEVFVSARTRDQLRTKASELLREYFGHDDFEITEVDAEAVQTMDLRIHGWKAQVTGHSTT